MLHPNRHHLRLINHGNSRVVHKTVHQIMALSTVLILVLMSLGVFTSSRALNSGIPQQDTNSVDSTRALPNLNSPVMKNQLTEHYAQNLYNTEHAGNANLKTPSLDAAESMQMLNSLREDQPAGKRASALATLTQASPSIVPVLLDALTNSDVGIRRSAAEALGARHAPEAENSLFFATFDSDAGVRMAAVKALGELGAIYALPRLDWIQVVETNSDVQLAARLAENQIYWRVAATLGVRPGDLRVVAVALTNERVYAATHSDLYIPHHLDWERVGTVPDIPTALVAAGDQGSILYLGTSSSGVFRSRDGGQTWQVINQNLPTNPFAVTALTVNPEDDRQVFVALALNPNSSSAMSFALYDSVDGGDSWAQLTPSMVDRITVRLIVDPTEPSRLLGLTDTGTWEYQLAKRTP